MSKPDVLFDLYELALLAGIEGTTPEASQVELVDAFEALEGASFFGSRLGKSDDDMYDDLCDLKDGVYERPGTIGGTR